MGQSLKTGSAAVTNDHAIYLDLQVPTAKYTVVPLSTVEPVLKDHPIGPKNVVSQDRWSLVTGSVALKSGTFCQEYVVLQDRWSSVAVVAQYRFHCTSYFNFKKGRNP